VARPEEIPLSYAQRRLWFLERLEGPNATYVIPLALRISGPLDHDALQGALCALTERHESLRTGFPERGGIARQVMLARSEARSSLAVSAVSEAELASALEQAAGQGFVLAREIPLRAHLFVLGEEEHVLLLALHHIAGDGWSLVPLLRDLSICYAARAEGRAGELPSLAVQYADYALWQQEDLGEESDNGSAIARQLAFWRERLAGLPDQLDLPGDRARPPVMSHRGGSVPLALPGDLHRGLTLFAREAGGGPVMGVQAGRCFLLPRPCSR